MFLKLCKGQHVFGSFIKNAQRAQCAQKAVALYLISYITDERRDTLYFITYKV